MFVPLRLGCSYDWAPYGCQPECLRAGEADGRNAGGLGLPAARSHYKRAVKNLTFTSAIALIAQPHAACQCHGEIMK